MPVIRSCLCFKDLLSASTASAIYIMVMAVLELIATIAYLSVTLQQGWQRSELDAARDIIIVLIEVLLLITGIILLEATIKGYSGQKLLMVAVHMLPAPILFEMGAGVYIMYLLISLAAQPNGTFIALSVVVCILWLLQLFFLIMCELAAVSLYQFLRKQTLLAVHLGHDLVSPQDSNKSVTSHPVGGHTVTSCPAEDNAYFFNGTSIFQDNHANGKY